ncbi:hypothetical protein [Flavobacterium sp. CF136]|uniref:hypothetical protein n=1 Tax=Flavobacterium sp. (strain CF136) TaxID=1144313 RepID=UPI000271B0A0|nr:hypothetical protein [Flavobacterium sp. CF136]EJL61376.1 hypothetical protein PMI10_03425 [Flavobacterium sp. CF136]
MDNEQLKNLFEFLEIHDFVKRISEENQKKYDLAFEELQKKVKIKKKKVFIENESFVRAIYHSLENGAKDLKIHLIKKAKDLDINIGFSFSNSKITEDGTIDRDLDLFWTLNDKGILVKSNRHEFKSYKDNFNATTSKEIKKHTNKPCTEFIKYDIDDVIRYIIRNLLSNTFDSKRFVFNYFVFKDYGADTKMNDRIGISVHNTLVQDSNKNELISIGYDFGTVYP